MAYAAQGRNNDLFAADDLFVDMDEEAETPVRVYGATSGSAPMLRVKSGSGEGDVADIPLHDFQPESHKDPLILTQSARAAPYVSTTIPRSQSSHSITSDMTNHSGFSDYNQYDSWVHHPKVRENCRLVLGSGFLMILGIVLIITGVGVALSPATGYHCIVIIVIGFLCFVPGGYHFIYIYCAAIGRPGFDFNSLPVLR